jgi:drug/metabolite transporter (DMT)-like permease
MSRPRSRRTLAWVAGTGLVVTWSSGFIGAELGTREASADTLLAWRYVAAAVVLTGLVVVTRRRPPWRASRRQAVLGLLCQGGYLGGVVWGVAVGVPAGTAALLTALQPLLVAALASRFLRTRISRGGAYALGLGLLGVATVVAGDLGTGGAPAWAFLLPLAGMASLSIGTVLERRWQPAESLLEAMTAQTLVVAIVFMLTAGVTGRIAPPASVGFWAAVLWVVVLSTFGGYGFYFLVLRLQGPSTVSTLLYLTPPCTLAWGWAMLGQEPSGLAYLGTTVCAAGVFVALRADRLAERSGQGRGLPTQLRRVATRVRQSPVGDFLYGIDTYHAIRHGTGWTHLSGRDGRDEPRPCG